MNKMDIGTLPDDFRHLVSYIIVHGSPDNPVSRKALLDFFDRRGTKLSDAQLRHNLIEVAINKYRIPIASRSDKDHGGYFMATTPEGREIGIREKKARIGSLQTSLNNFEMAYYEWTEGKLI